MNSIIKDPEIIPQFFEFMEPSSWLIIDKFQFKFTEPEYNITLP